MQDAPRQIEIGPRQGERTDVLIPHYRDVSGLRKTIDSVESQTWQGPIRIVVADDGSGAEIQAGVRERLEESPLESVLLSSQDNRGRPFTRNRLMDAIDSPWVSWLDSGDVWYDEKLEKQFSCLEQITSEGTSVDRAWITCNYDWNWIGRGSEPVRQIVSDDPFRDLLEGKRLRAYLWTLLSSSEAMKCVGSFDEQLSRQQDLDFFLRFIDIGGSIHTAGGETGNTMCRYEKSDEGRDPDEIHRCNLRILNKHKTAIERYGAAFLRQRRIGADLLAVRIAKNNGDLRRVLYYTALAAGRDPVRALTQLAKKALSEKRK